MVTIGNFFPDAYLESVRIGTAEYPVEDLIKYGMLVKTTYPNRTISYTLTVSFQNPDVTEEVRFQFFVKWGEGRILRLLFIFIFLNVQW